MILKHKISAIVAMMAFMLSSSFAGAETFTVTTAGDANTANCGAGQECSLRGAIQKTIDNGAIEHDDIRFNIPGAGPYMVAPLLTALPSLAQTTIDGSTQPGFDGTPLVVVDGSSMTGATSTTCGLCLDGDSKIVSLSIKNFPIGVKMHVAGHNVVEGSALLSNGQGVSILGNVENKIGGASPAQKNKISNSFGAGIVLDNTCNLVI